MFLEPGSELGPVGAAEHRQIIAHERHDTTPSGLTPAGTGYDAHDSLAAGVPFAAGIYIGGGALVLILIIIVIVLMLRCAERRTAVAGDATIPASSYTCAVDATVQAGDCP